MTNSKKNENVETVPIEKIVVDKRKRKSLKTDLLSDSIKQLGMCNPILINKDYKLISGYHRLQACRELGKTEILARICDVDDLNAELMEIDENLARNELTALEIAEQTKRRKEIYEEIHPESTNKAIRTNNLSKRKDFVLDNASKTPISFAQDMANKNGYSKRTIQQNIQIATNLTPETKEKIIGTDIENNKTQLLYLARTENDKQIEEVDKILNNQKTNTPEKTLPDSEKKFLQVPEKTYEMADYIDEERRYIVYNWYMLPIPIGVDIKVLDHEYIKFLAILNANLKFKLKLKPLYLLNLCNSCEFANKVLKKCKRKPKLNEFQKKLDGLYKDKRKYMSEKGLLSKDKKKEFLDIIEKKIAITLKEIENIEKQ